MGDDIVGKRKTHQEFLTEVENLTGDEYVFLEEYVNNSTKIKVIHTKQHHVRYKIFIFMDWIV